MVGPMITSLSSRPLTATSTASRATAAPAQSPTDQVTLSSETPPKKWTVLVWSAADSNGTWMSLPKIQQGLQEAHQATGRKLDVVGFDACLMANTEVAHQLKDEADFLVGSQEVEGGAGWPYNRVLSKTMLDSLEQTL